MGGWIKCYHYRRYGTEIDKVSHLILNLLWLYALLFLKVTSSWSCYLTLLVVYKKASNSSDITSYYSQPWLRVFQLWWLQLHLISKCEVFAPLEEFSGLSCDECLYLYSMKCYSMKCSFTSILYLTLGEALYRRYLDTICKDDRDLTSQSTNFSYKSYFVE